MRYTLSVSYTHLDVYKRQGYDRESPAHSRIRFRNWSLAAAACLCVIIGSGAGYNVYRNGKIDSIIGIDVNPSVELSINRKNKVLNAVPLNDDAVEILEGMELKGVDLNICLLYTSKRFRWRCA